MVKFPISSTQDEMPKFHTEISGFQGDSRLHFTFLDQDLACPACIKTRIALSISLHRVRDRLSAIRLTNFQVIGALFTNCALFEIFCPAPIQLR